MNFNFGEHYYEGASIWTDLAVTIFGGIIGFGTALWFYYRQNQRDKAKEIKETDQEFKDTLNYLKLLIDGVVTTIEQQSKKSIEFVEKVKANPVEIEYLMIIAGQDIERLHSIDPSKVFLTFRHRFSKEDNWLKDFQKLYNHLDFIQGHRKENITIFRKYQEGIYKQLIRFKTIVDNIPDTMFDMSLEIKRTVADYKNDERYLFLEESIMKYRVLADNDSKIAEYDNKFLRPIIEDTIKKYQLEFFGPRIIYMCKKAIVLLNDIIVDSNETADSILTSPRQLENSRIYLIDTSKKIGN